MKIFQVLKIITRKSISDIEFTRKFVEYIVTNYPRVLDDYLQVVSLEFSKVNGKSSPNLKIYIEDNQEKGLYVVLIGNLLKLPTYFPQNNERISALSLIHFAHLMQKNRKEIEIELASYKRIMISIGYGSKNLTSITASTLFHVLNLYPFQSDYYAERKTISPLLLKNLIPVTEKLFFPWQDFMKEYRLNF